MVIFFKHRATASVVLFALISALTTSATYTWPNHVIDELEHLLVDTGGFNDGGVKNAITPCTNYASGSATLGRGTSAEWLRVAFHDVATADVSAGTGGLDASIGFETLRPENAGPAMNDTIGFFAPYVNAYVSMADLIALSVVMTLGNCASPTMSVPLRGGRIDAKEAGPSGVPEADTSVHATLQRFEGIGFDQSDTIILTACGHSLGGVHHSTFPDIVPASAVLPNNTDGGVTFDSTVGTIDVNVVTDYLHGTGLQGGPLVTSSNVTVRSDFRLYNSDGNTTLKDLATSPSRFASECVRVITHMINTVPAAVTLTDVITPNIVKPVGISLTVDSTGNIALSGYIRLLSSGFSKDAIVTVSWTPRIGSASGSASTQAYLTENGTSNFGTTYYHSFNASIDPTTGISGFTITVKDGSKTTVHTNGGGGYPVQDAVMWVPAEPSMSQNSVFVRAAVLKSLNSKSVSAVFSIPTPQSGTLSPKIKASTFSLTEEKTLGLYTLYSGLAEVSLTNVTQTIVDIVADTSNGVVRSMFNKL